MSSEAVRKVIETRLSERWSITPIVWDNVKYKPILGTSFIRCSLDEIDSEILSISCQRKYFVFVVQVFTPLNSGQSESLSLSDALQSIFTNQIIGSCECSVTTFGDCGFGAVNEGNDSIVYVNGKTGITQRIGEEKGWYQRNVIIDIYSDFNF